MWGPKSSLPEQPTVWDIIARLAQEADQQGQPSPVLDHSAPRQPFALDEAHSVLQTHRACERTLCPRKAAAWGVLVAAGRIRPRPANGSM